MDRAGSIVIPSVRVLETHPDDDRSSPRSARFADVKRLRHIDRIGHNGEVSGPASESEGFR